MILKIIHEHDKVFALPLAVKCSGSSVVATVCIL